MSGPFHLQAVEPRRLYRQIADQIRALIASGRALPGTRLPPERDLAQQLGVSRPSLREAIIALEVAGLLDVRVGSGIYVNAVKASARARKRTVPLSASGPFEVIQARRMIEGECAALAAKVATQEQVSTLRDTHAMLVRESRRRRNPLEIDRLFHLRIAEASGNSALALVVETLWDQRVGPLYRALEAKMEYPRMAADTVREHLAIVTAIAARDPRAARSALHRHMNLTRARLSRDWRLERQLPAGR